MNTSDERKGNLIVHIRSYDGCTVKRITCQEMEILHHTHLTFIKRWSIMENSGRTETLYRYKTVSSVSHGYLYTYTYNSTNQPQLCLTLLRWLPHPSRWKTDEYGWFLAWDAYLAKVLTQCSTCLGWLPPVGSLDVLPWSSYHQPLLPQVQWLHLAL